MDKVTKVGRFLVETNGSGEIFLTVGKTILRISNIHREPSDDIRVTFSGNEGIFIPDNVGGKPAMVFRG